MPCLSQCTRVLPRRPEQHAEHPAGGLLGSSETREHFGEPGPGPTPLARAASGFRARLRPRGWLRATLLGLLFLAPNAAHAALTLTWQDNASNASGYAVERGATAAGPFGTLVTGLAANATSYVDSTATPGTQYCYRVYGYNSAGASGYSNVACGTAQVQSYTVTLAYAGTGTGTVTGGGTYPSGTAVKLTEAPGTGSTFGGWSGGGCSGTATMCTFNLTSNVIVTATFALAPASTYTLTVQTAGTGSGTVSGAGTYAVGAIVSLTATPASGSTFAGWSGTAPCPSGNATPASFTMPAATMGCTATFTLAGSTTTHSVAFNPPPPGPQGTWVSLFGGINWGQTWAWWLPEAGIPVNHVDFGAAGVTSRTFAFSPGPKKLLSISLGKVTTRSSGGSITISDNNGQSKKVSITPGHVLTVTLNWPKVSTWVKVSSDLGWDMAVTALTYK